MNHDRTGALLSLILVEASIFLTSVTPAFAQVSKQSNNTIQRNLERQPPPLEPPPLPEAVPDSPLQIPGHELLPEVIPGDRSILVEQFQITGNTVFSTAILQRLPLHPDGLPLSSGSEGQNQNGDKSCLPDTDVSGETIGSVANRAFSIAELIQVAATVATFYGCEGYRTSGAISVIPETTQAIGQGIVEIQVIEGRLATAPDVVSNTERSIFTLNDSYVRSRLHLDPNEPLNVTELQESLQLLQLNPLIDTISATLQDGAQPGESLLRVEFEDAPYSPLVISADNGRSPSVGSFQQRVQFDTPNLLGVGDSLRLAYTRTDGSDGGEIRYRIPLTAEDTTLNLRHSTTSSDVIEPPFDDIDGDGNGPDIESKSQIYEATLRHPVSRNVSDRTFREFAVGLTTSSQRSKSELLEFPFPSAGSDEDGVTNIFALRFFQEWTQQNTKEVVALRSQFNVGLDAFDSTINNQLEGVEPIPDSRFFSWQGQAQWVRLLSRDTLLQLRGTMQLADNVLLPAEQFAIGGAGSVRGYRQDQLQADNGLFGSLEVQLPIIRHRRSDSVVHLVPFFDWGHVWNASGSETIDPNTLSSLGLGLQWRWGDRVTARLEYGIPLVNLESRDRTWQENGLLFNIHIKPF